MTKRQLSIRQLQTLQLAAEGLTDAQIAEQLGISMSSVKTYIQGIFRKLEAVNRTEAVTKGFRAELLE